MADVVGLPRAAILAGIGYQRAYGLVTQGAWPAERDESGRWLVRRDSLDRWLARREESDPQAAGSR